MTVRAFLVENNIVTNECVFVDEAAATSQGYVTFDYEMVGIGDDVSDMEALKQLKENPANVIDETESLMSIDMIREERNKLLAETDWWASSDRTMTTEQRDYRQALRDLPNNVLAGDPTANVEGEDGYANVQFPTKP